MMKTLKHCRLPTGFSFIEVLFAVILLGIGFIMIAGIFPVAIQQTAAVSDETQGAIIARDGIQKLQGLADSQVIGPNRTNTLFPRTINGNGVPVVEAFSYNLTQAIGTDAFFNADRRYAWVGFYRRDSDTSPFAQVFLIALQNPNFPNYTTLYPPGEGTTAINPPPAIPPMVAPPIPPTLYNYVPPSPTTGPAAAVPAAIPATLTYSGLTGYSTLQLDISWTNAVTGAYVLIADDATVTGKTIPAPVLNGRILRLGAETTASVSLGPRTFNLEPGFDLSLDDMTRLQAAGNPATDVKNNWTANVTVFIMGRAPILNSTNNDYAVPLANFTGPNQDIGAVSAYIRLNTTNN